MINRSSVSERFISGTRGEETVHYEFRMSRPLEERFRAMLPDDPFGGESIPVYTTRERVTTPRAWSAAQRNTFEEVHRYFFAEGERFHLRPGIEIMKKSADDSIMRNIVRVALLPLDQHGFDEFTRPLMRLPTTDYQPLVGHHYYVEVPAEFLPLGEQRKRAFEAFDNEVASIETLGSFAMQRVGITVARPFVFPAQSQAEEAS